MEAYFGALFQDVFRVKGRKCFIGHGDANLFIDTCVNLLVGIFDRFVFRFKLTLSWETVPENFTHKDGLSTPSKFWTTVDVENFFTQE